MLVQCLSPQQPQVGDYFEMQGECCGVAREPQHQVPLYVSHQGNLAHLGHLTAAQ